MLSNGREIEREREREREKRMTDFHTKPDVLPAVSDPTLPSGQFPVACSFAGESGLSLPLAPNLSLSARQQYTQDITLHRYFKLHSIYMRIQTYM